MAMPSKKYQRRASRASSSAILRRWFSATSSRSSRSSLGVRSRSLFRRGLRVSVNDSLPLRTKDEPFAVITSSFEYRTISGLLRPGIWIVRRLANRCKSQITEAPPFGGASGWFACLLHAYHHRHPPGDPKKSKEECTDE